MLVVEGEERHLKPWDFFHCPPWTKHTFVGAGDGPCVIVMAGSRAGGFEVVYAVDEVAAKHGASVPEETSKPDEAYSGFGPEERSAYREGGCRLSQLGRSQAGRTSRPWRPQYLRSATRP